MDTSVCGGCCAAPARVSAQLLKPLKPLSEEQVLSEEKGCRVAEVSTVGSQVPYQAIESTVPKQKGGADGMAPGPQQPGILIDLGATLGPHKHLPSTWQRLMGNNCASSLVQMMPRQMLWEESGFRNPPKSGQSATENQSSFIRGLLPNKDRMPDAEAMPQPEWNPKPIPSHSTQET